MKRYAIVRVDKECCPLIDENYKCVKGMSCLKCEKLYGDTKEQLVKKISQVIKRKLEGDCVAGLKDTVFVQKWCCVEALAKEIVEFLGVE